MKGLRLSGRLCLVWGSSAGILLGRLRAGAVDSTTERDAPVCPGVHAALHSLRAIHLSYIHRGRVHIAPKTELGKVRVVLFKNSSLSILYTKTSVYLEVTLKEPQLRNKNPSLSKGIFA